MRINITTNASKIEKMTAKRGRKLRDATKKALSITAQEGINIILDRTADHKSIDGKPFKKYTPEYRDFRAAARRGTKPDLNFSGKMLGSITSRADHKKAEIFFSMGSEAKKAAMNNKKRPFFGFSDRETDVLREVFKRELL